MLKSQVVLAAIASLGILCQGAIAQSMPSDQSGPFQRIEQPVANKVIVTLGGLGLIGLELWWFLGSKSRVKGGDRQRQ